MLLRMRVALPDRPGTLGQVARTLGVAGADIVQVVVLERVAGRAVDDFTVSWPASAPVDRILAGLAAVPGVRVDGVWRAAEPLEISGRDAAIVGQVASDLSNGIVTLVDTVPGVIAADWAMAVVVGPGWADGEGQRLTEAVRSWRAPLVPPKAVITPLRPRAARANDGTHLALAPFGRGGLVMVVARGGPGGDAGAPPFHQSEVDRLAQVVDAVAAVLGDRLAESGSVGPDDRAGAAPEPAPASRVDELVGG